MSIDRGLDTEVVVYIYNGILLSHYKQWNKAICSTMDRPRGCHTEWINQRRRNIIWQPLFVEAKKKWYKRTDLQTRKRLIDLENELMVARGKEIVKDFGKVMFYTLLCLKWITNKNLLYSTWNSAQRYVPAWMGEGFGGEWIHVCVWLSPFTVPLKLSQHC